METVQTNMIKLTMDSISVESRRESFSLRRKSAQGLDSGILPENDDEVERLARRHQIDSSTTLAKNTNRANRRVSLGLGSLANVPLPEIARNISQCIQMNTDNKINIKNAFSFEVIDFMTYLAKKQDDNMINLQFASSSLDVSAKIYGYRVDGIHKEMLKIVSTTDKEDQDIGANRDSDEKDGILETQISQQKTKRKKKTKPKLLSTATALRGITETSKPSIFMSKEDTQTTDTLQQAALPIHGSFGYYLHPCNDIIVDKIENIVCHNSDLACVAPHIENILELDICPPLSGFEFHNWAEENDVLENTLNESKSNLEFDLDASMHDTESLPCSTNYLDIEDEKCMEIHSKVSCEVQNIVDFKQVMKVTAGMQPSEYSFVQKSLNIHWAGPSHWKIGRFARSVNESKIVATCPQVAAKKKKGIELSYNKNEFDALNKHFIQSQVGKLQYKTAKVEWTEEALTLPWDMCYNITSTLKLYLHKLFVIKDKSAVDLNATHFPDDLNDYDYNNENDTSNYCPNIVHEDSDTNDECRYEHEEHLQDGKEQVESQTAFTGDNLIAPPKFVNKIPIAYSTRSKKIDMRMLKLSIWKTLISSCNKDVDTREIRVNATVNTQKRDIRFSEVSKVLPTILTKANADVLSFPISFISLLHLANEKALEINGIPDMSDFIVSGNYECE